MATGAVRVRGLKELTRDFKKISKDLSKELRKELVEAAEPVKQSAQSLALGKIRNMPRSPHWAGMRVGVSQAQGVVYMVPAARSRRMRGRSRPNLANLLLERAMEPALVENELLIVERVDFMLGRLAHEHGF
jgi:hypothetical protein